MDVLNVLEKSYIIINRNFKFYKQNFGHTYYKNVKDEETNFIDKMFKNMENVLSAQDKMLNYSVSTIYTATAVLVEFMERYRIEYTAWQLENICKGFSAIPKEEMRLTDKSDVELEEILFGLLTEGIDLDSRKKSGSERTPDEIIDYMLSIIEYEGIEITERKIIDPACGTGTFIAKIVQRFIDALAKAEKLYEVKEKLLKDRLIQAYDTKPSNVYVTKIVLLSILIRNDVIHDTEDIIELLHNLPILCEDFLTVTEKTDYVVGNPPYIRLQNLSDRYREFIKSRFVSATGRFDIYTCFIENSDKILNENGRMCLITSDKYLTANYGIGIRRYLSQTGHVRKIIDLYDTKFFGAAVLPAIIMCENSTLINSNVKYIGIKCTSQKPQYDCQNAVELFQHIENKTMGNKSIVRYGGKECIFFEVTCSDMKIPEEGKTWNFSSISENNIKNKMDEKKSCTLGDIFDVCVGIKTTADIVFVKPMTKKFIKEREFEEEVIYPLIQSFDIDRWSVTWGNHPKDRYILYPHKEEQGGMSAIPLEEIPKAKKYLEECSDTLKKRTYLTGAKNREWYECWVPQKLSKFRQPKIVTRDIVSHNTFAFDDSGKLCQGNTFFLTRKQSVLSMEFASMTEKQYYLFILGMLNSKVMEYYQKMISGCLYSKKYRYTTTNLSRWPVPRIGLAQAQRIGELVDQLLCGEGSQECIEKQINEMMYSLFELGKDEILEIENFVTINK